MSGILPRNGFDVALIIDAKADLKTVALIFDALSDSEIYPDYATLDFEKDGLYFDGKTYKEEIKDEIEKIIERFGHLSIDWDLMAEWDSEVED